MSARIRSIARSIAHHCLLVLLIASIVQAAGLTARAVDDPDPLLSAELVARVPEAYRDKAREIRLAADLQTRYRTLNDTGVFSLVISRLAQTPDGVAFLAGMVDKETSSERRARLLSMVAGAPSAPAYFAAHPEAVQAYARYAASVTDPNEALRIIRALRRIRQEEVLAVLTMRMDMARAAGDQATLETLSEEESRAGYKWFGTVAMPAVYRDAPPVFSVATAEKPIRVVAFGDFGTGQQSQIKTAAAIRTYAKDHPFDFGLTLGDNYYPMGADTPSDPRWKTQWEDLYGPLSIPFYASLGNHDYGQAGSPLAEILYSEKSPSWRMPARYYTFTAGAAQFFNVDTVDLTERELRWLDEELGKSQATWKIVYGHYQIYSATRGDNDTKQDDLVHRLLPVLKKHHVDLYLCGHDHNLQILKPEGSVNFVVAGAGGAGVYEFRQKDYTRNTFKEKANGFAVLEVDAKSLRVRLINVDGREGGRLDLARER